MYYPRICFQGPGRDSNQASPEFKSSVTATATGSTRKGRKGDRKRKKDVRGKDKKEEYSADSCTSAAVLMSGAEVNISSRRGPRAV
jgi:hypothetical protein